MTPRSSVALLAGALLVLAVMFGARAYENWQALHQPPVARIAITAQIQPWMTVRYIARRYGVSQADLAARLGVAPQGTTTLLALAQQRREPVEQVLTETRLAVRDLQASQPASDAGPPRQ